MLRMYLLYSRLAIMKYNREISEAVFVLYDNNEEYKDFAYVLNKVHIDNNKLFQQIVSTLLIAEFGNFYTKRTN